jgi:hypothetical protein
MGSGIWWREMQQGACGGAVCCLMTMAAAGAAWEAVARQVQVLPLPVYGLGVRLGVDRPLQAVCQPCPIRHATASFAVIGGRLEIPTDPHGR